MGQTAGQPSATLGLTESQITTALDSYLKTILPTGVSVTLGQQNRVSPPLGPYLVMTIIGRERLGTNTWTYTATTRAVITPTEMTIQVGSYGTGAGDNIQIVLSTFRDMYAADFFTSLGMPVAPLYCVGPRQEVFINASNQYEDAWNADLHFQANVLTTLAQATATSAKAEPISIDATYPA